MHQPDISNAAQQAQEEASAMDVKRFAQELDQAGPRVGPDGWAEIDGDESVWPEQRAVQVSRPAAAVVDRKIGDASPGLSVPDSMEMESRFSRLKRFLGSLVH